MWALALLMEMGPHQDRKKLWPGWEMNNNNKKKKKKKKKNNNNNLYSAIQLLFHSALQWSD